MPTQRRIPALVQSNSAVLPPLFGRWISEMLTAAIPPEALATCQDCAMCPKGDETGIPDERFFHPSAKCCTYTPTLPNFLVGAIIQDVDQASARGRETVLERIRAKQGVSPLAVNPPSDYSLRYDHMSAESFGSTCAMRCPHYVDQNGGLCGIWRHRNSVCATWFCKHVRGEIGSTFWESMHRLLDEIEKSLSLWAASQNGLDTASLCTLIGGDSEATEDQLDAYELDGRVDAQAYGNLWGHWQGREVDFFRRSHTLVKDLTWKQVLAIGGIQTRLLADVARTHYAKLMSDEIPQHLKLASFQVLGVGKSGMRIAGYSPSNPLEMSPQLMGVLRYFDGSPTANILRVIEKEQRIQLDGALLRKLLDYGLLENAKSRTRVDSRPASNWDYGFKKPRQGA